MTDSRPTPTPSPTPSPLVHFANSQDASTSDAQELKRNAVREHDAAPRKPLNSRLALSV